MYSVKDFAANVLTDEKSFHNGKNTLKIFLNPVKASTRGTQEVAHLGKEEVFTAAEVATAIKG